jgi:hypothetical protein
VRFGIVVGAHHARAMDQCGNAPLAKPRHEIGKCGGVKEVDLERLDSRRERWRVVPSIDPDHGPVAARKSLGKGKSDSRGAAGNDAGAHVLASPLAIYLLTVISTETIALVIAR